MLTATFNSYGDEQISTLYKINTPEPVDKKFGVVDYVREGTLSDGTWNVCLVSTLDPSFMVAGRWLRGGRTAWYGYGIVGMMCRSLLSYKLELCSPSYHLLSVRFLSFGILSNCNKFLSFRLFLFSKI